MNQIYSDRGNLALGFHGCKKSVANEIIANPDFIKSSKNDWDWLGAGFYIWENNMQRALEWAQKIYGDDGVVLGVVYELGTCLDLMDSESIQLIKIARKELESDLNAIGKIMPSNKDFNKDPEKDKILRYLDCAVINYLTSRTDTAYMDDIVELGYSHTRPFDSVRGCFTEGAKISGMEIFEKTHIQIAIRNLNCIKGFFLPRNQCVFP